MKTLKYGFYGEDDAQKIFLTHYSAIDIMTQTVEKLYLIAWMTWNVRQDVNIKRQEPRTSFAARMRHFTSRTQISPY